MNLAQIIIDVKQGGQVDLQQRAIESLGQLATTYPFVAVLLGLMVLDIVTGIIAAFVSKRLCSTASYRGMMGKVQILAMVATAMLMEVIVPNVPWGTFVAIFFCVTEALSITENAANSGVPIPRQWVEALKKAKEEESKPTAPLVELVINESDKEAIKDAVDETKSAIRRGVHDIRDDLNAAALKAEIAKREERP